MESRSASTSDEARSDAPGSPAGTGQSDQNRTPSPEIPIPSRNRDGASLALHHTVQDSATDRQKTSIQERPQVGGQAVIEGVMMIAPGAVAVVVRKPSGEMGSMVRPFMSLTKRKSPFRFPLFRGGVALVEMLSLGIQALTFSANEALGEDQKGKGSPALTLTLAVAILLGIGIFVYLPIFLAGVIGSGENQTVFNLVAGGIRLVFFLLYLYLITLIPDVRRVFAYHGAEHKSVACFEAGEDLTVENARKHSPRHARCGTSFLLLVLIVALVLFAIVDTIVFGKMGLPPRRIYRLAVHLALLPFVAGISYEFTRLASRKKRSRFFRSLAAPGLALQRITTREPSDDQIQVGLEALRLALSEAGIEPANLNN